MACRAPVSIREPWLGFADIREDGRRRRSIMEQATLSPLAAWRGFYGIIGPSAAALTGLQFVVIVLGAQVNVLGSASTTRAFGTPTIVHFCAALLVSAVMSAPWHGLSTVAVGFGACGAAGIVYELVGIRHARRQTSYVPVLEDWLWHCVLPVIAYGALLVAAILLTRRPEASLFVIGATALLLLFIGIHNAWDAVTYVALERQKPERAGGQS
jgi:hypothetical protein